jgi:hypothetical protein
MNGVTEGRSAMSAPELTVCLVVLVAAGVLAFGSHVLHGGFISDDWAAADNYRNRGYGGFALHLARDVGPGRPVLDALQPLPHAVFGLNFGLHLGLAVLLGVAASFCFYVLLRTLDLEPVPSGVIAVLALVFPWSDSTRLWPTLSIANVGICLYLLGTVAALRGLDPGRRRGLRGHAPAAALYVLSLLTYEVVGCAILLSGLLYRTRAGWRRVRSRWIVDATIVIVILGIDAVLTAQVRDVATLGERLGAVEPFIRDGLALFTSMFLPSSASTRTAKLIVLLVAVAVAVAAVRQARDPSRAALRRWLLLATGATIGVVAAYVMFLGSSLLPLTSGIDNRTNILAGFGFATLAYATVMTIGELAAPRRGQAWVLLVGVATCLVAAGFVDRLRADISNWDRAAASQQRLLTALERTLPRPPRGSTIYSFNYPAQSAPGVPIFAKSWDLTGAARLIWHDPSLRAFPIAGDGRVVCGPAGVSVPALDTRPSRYESSVFVDVSASRAEFVRSRARCHSLSTRFRPGPDVAASEN